MKLAKKTLSVALAAVMAASSLAGTVSAFAAVDPETATYTALKLGTNAVKTTITAKADETDWSKQVEDNAKSSWLTFTPDATGYYKISASTKPIYKGYDATQKDTAKRSALTFSTSYNNLVSNTTGTNAQIKSDAYDAATDTGRVDSFKLEMAGNSKSATLKKADTNDFQKIEISKDNKWARDDSQKYSTVAKFDTSEVKGQEDKDQTKFVDTSASREYVFCEGGKTYYFKATLVDTVYDQTSAYTEKKKDSKGTEYKVQTQAVAPEATITIAKSDWGISNAGLNFKEVKVEVPSWYNGTYKSSLKQENGKWYVTVNDIVKEPTMELSYSGLARTVNVPAKFEGYNVTKFVDCANLGVTAAKIPASVKAIGDSAFEGCRNLKTVTFNEGLETIGQEAFYDTALESVVLPKSLKTIGNDAFAWTKITKVTVKNDDLDISNAGFGTFTAANGYNDYTDKSKVQIICNASTKAAYYAALAGFNIKNDCKGNHTYKVTKAATIFAAGEKVCTLCGTKAVIAKVKFAPTVKKASKKRIVVKGNAGKVSKLAVWVYDSKGKLVKKQVKKNVTKNTVKVAKAGKYTVKVKAYGTKGAKTASVKKTVKVK